MNKNHKYSDNCICVSCKSIRGETAGEKAGNYKDGRTLKKVYYCSCGAKISMKTFLYGKKKM